MASDRFEPELREHLQREAQRVARFPGHLSERIRQGIEPRHRYSEFQQLAAAAAVILLAAGLSFGANRLRDLKENAPPPQSAATARPSAQLSASASASVLPTANPPFSCVDRVGGNPTATAGPGATAMLSRVAVAHHVDGDWLVFEFGGQVLPSYTLKQQSDTAFIKDPSGMSVNLRGAAGLHVIFKYATGQGSWDGKVIGAGSAAVITDVTELGDNEHVLGFGIGLSHPSCTNINELSGPSRLLLKIRTP